MEGALLTVFAVVMVLLFAATIWFTICNNRTAEQREMIINWVYEDIDTWRARSRVYNAVSYDRHLWALFTMHDPMKLYNWENVG